MTVTSRGLIVLAEDQDSLRKLYRDVLEAHGFSVFTANNGEQAIQLCISNTPKLLILDIMMPGMDGIEACGRIRKILGSTVPIIFLSSLDTRETVRACLEAGGDDYIIKSESLAKLIERVEFWTRPKTPHARERRREVLTSARDALARPQAEMASRQMKLAEGPPTIQNDDVLLRVSRVVALARALANPDFGNVHAEQVFMLGYLTGSVEYWAQRTPEVKRRFDEYLRAALRDTGIVDKAQGDRLIAALIDFVNEQTFKSGRAAGRREANEAENGAGPFEPMALRDFEESRRVPDGRR